MGGLAPGKLKSRRGWPSSPRRLIHGCYFFDPGFKNSLREKLYQLCGNGDTLIAIDSRRPGLFWSAKVALSFAATGTVARQIVVQPHDHVRSTVGYLSAPKPWMLPPQAFDNPA